MSKAELFFEVGVSVFMQRLVTIEKIRLPTFLPMKMTNDAGLKMMTGVLCFIESPEVSVWVDNFNNMGYTLCQRQQA